MENSNINRPKYPRIEYWILRGFISDKLGYEKKLTLSRNLDYAKSMLTCKKILTDNIEFFDNVSLVLYPIIVYYTDRYDVKKVFELMKKFIYYCEDNLYEKYDLSVYDDDYRLCMDFINEKENN